jgi:Tfp pilus assembly protein PilF
MLTTQHAATSCVLMLQVWRELALAYASQQQPADAEKCVQHMRQLDPNSAASYHALGAVAASCRNDVAAKAAYKAALALDAAYAPALLSLGE